ncbi:Uncharacterised protein [Serratia fonticola]|uniref:YfjI family protein n=1 Tax=Serratia fonticola TaxID=47917 RepID=UPI00217B5FC9|nr:YfjI family protein [Serratia fonticola]CAI1733780.1 Uncharacterised protein [Serratia fonticola]
MSYTPVNWQPSMFPLMQYPFPSYALPELLYKTFHNVSNKTQAPEGLIANTLLAAISLACQGHIDVSPIEGLVHPTSLYTYAIAESGERKSSVDDEIMAPFQAFDLAMSEAHVALQRNYEARHQIWSTKQSAYFNMIKRKTKRNEPTDAEELQLLEHKAREPQRPCLRKLLYSNTTPQALLADMDGVGRSVGLIADEGGTILDRGVMQDLSSLNQFWDGGSMSVDRKTTTSIRITEGRLTFSVQVQRAVHERFLRRQGDVPRGSGFNARCLSVEVDESTSTKGYRVIDGRYMHRDGLDRFHERISELLESHVNGQPRKILCFSREAQVRWMEYANHIEHQIRPGGTYHSISDIASKMANNIARIAALIQYVTEGEGEISRTKVDAAFDICQWYAYQALRMFSPKAECLQNTRDAGELLVWLDRKFREKNVMSMKKNDIRRNGPSGLRDKEKLAAALDLLAHTGRVTFGIGPNKTTYVNAGQYFHHPLIV